MGKKKVLISNSGFFAPPSLVLVLSLPGWTFLWLTYWTSWVPSLWPDAADGARKGQRRRWSCPEQRAAGPSSPRPPPLSSTRRRTRRRAEYWRTFSSFADWGDNTKVMEQVMVPWYLHVVPDCLFLLFPFLTFTTNKFLHSTSAAANGSFCVYDRKCVTDEQTCSLLANQGPMKTQHTTLLF